MPLGRSGFAIEISLPIAIRMFWVAFIKSSESCFTKLEQLKWGRNLGLQQKGNLK